MVRKHSLVLALVASLALCSGPGTRKAKSDDFLRNAAGAAFIMGGVASLIQSTQPQVNMYPGAYPIQPGFYPQTQPIYYPQPPVYYPPTQVYYPPAPGFVPGGGMPGVMPVVYPAVQPQFFTTILP